MGRQLASIVLSTLSDGSLYALLGTGFVVLFRCTGVINFAQGALMALSGYIYLAATDIGLAWPLAVVGSVLFAMLLGAILYLGIFRRLVGASLFALVIATLGLATVITVVMNVIWGPQVRNLEPPFSSEPWFRIAGKPFVALDLFVVVLAVVGVGAVLALVQKTQLGTRMRAVASSPLLAGLSRVNVHAVSALAWSLAAGLTALAGVAFSLRASLDPVAAQGFGLVAFVAVLIGGLDSLRGAVLGGFLLAFAQAVVTVVLDASWSEVLAYSALLLVLFVRPQGIYGSPQVVRL